MRVRLNHCLPEYGVCGDKLLTGPSQLCGTASQEIWRAVTCQPHSASSKICSLCPLPQPNSENGERAASHTRSSSSCVPSALGTVKAEIGGKVFRSSSIMHRDAAGQGVSTRLICSQRVSFVRRLRVKTSPARSTKQSSVLPVSHDHNRLYYA